MSVKRSRSASSSLSPPPMAGPPPVSTPASPPPKPVAARRAAKKPKQEDVDPASLPTRSSSRIRIGAHVSAAGGVDQTCLNAAQIGATAFALFVKSQRKWSAPPLEPVSVELFKEACKKFSYSPATDMLPHGSYLVNLGNPAEEKRQKSYDCFLDDLQRCEAFGIGLYNFHPGSAMKEDRATACGYVADAINRAHRATSTITIVLENMAGQGDVLGSRFEDLRQIIELVDDKDRVGCCIDVCHLFAAGNDIRTPELLHQTLSDFFHLVPPHYLKALHVNDSKFDLGAKKDRHENLGLGFLGLASFWNLLHWPGPDGGSTAWEGWKDVIWVLETPSSENAEIWRREIEILHQLEDLEDPAEVPAIEAAWKVECARLQGEGKQKKPKARGKGKGKAAQRDDSDDADDDGEADEADEDVRPVKSKVRAAAKKVPAASRKNKKRKAELSSESQSSEEDVKPPPKRRAPRKGIETGETG